MIRRIKLLAKPQTKIWPWLPCLQFILEKTIIAVALVR
jgi:hypothetical protein